MLRGRPNAGGVSLAIAWALCFSMGCVPPAQPAPPEPAAQAPLATSRILLDERFQRTWPDDPHGNAWFGGLAYHLLARQPGQFVAIRAPIADVPSDVAVRGSFHKIGGPPGGGFGLIVRDQSVSAGDGIDQNGQYLVAAASDRGEVGIWQRANSHWIDLLPWTSSAYVHPGAATNVLKVEVVGNHLRFDVNGARVGDVEVGYTTGSVGIFVGGDLNEVQLDRLQVEAAATSASRETAAPAQPDIQATRVRLNALTARASQDPSVMQDAGWRQEIAATLAAVQQIASRGSAPSTVTTPASLDAQRLEKLLGGIADDVSSIFDALTSGVDSPRNPVNSPGALKQAAARLDSATRQANQVLAEVEAARNANHLPVPGH